MSARFVSVDTDDHLLPADVDAANLQPIREAAQDAASVGQGAAVGVQVQAVATADLAGQVVAEPAAAPLTTPTYDGSGNATHPSVVYVPGGFGGYEYWMAMTPYPHPTYSKDENPSILASHDGTTWVVPDGLTNPIQPKPTTHVNDYHSDTDLVLADGVLYCFYRAVESGSVGTEERFYVKSSADGVSWSPQELVQSRPAADMFVSPSVVYRNGEWWLWALEGDTNKVWLYRGPSPTGPWDAGTECTGFAFNGGYKPWHFDVERDGDFFVMLSMVNPGGTPTPSGGQLYRSISHDGETWTTDRRPFLGGRYLSGAWDAGLYRSCMIPAFVGGRRGYRVWYAGVEALPESVNHFRIGETFGVIEPEGPPATPLAPFLGLGVGGGADTFNRADDAESLGAMTTGQTWSTLGGTAAGVEDRQAYSAVGTALPSFNTGLTDYRCGVTVTAVGTTAADACALHFATPNIGNRVTLYRSVAAGLWHLSEWVSSVEAIRSTLRTPHEPGTKLRAEFKDGVASAWVDDLLVGRFTVTAGGSIVGLSVGGAGRMDDFWFEPL